MTLPPDPPLLAPPAILGHCYPAHWAPPNPPISLDPVVIVRVPDGDTLWLVIHGQLHRARLIGIDAPEYFHPHRRRHRFAHVSRAALATLAHAYPWLAYTDPAQPGHDAYQRIRVHLLSPSLHHSLAALLLASGLAWHVKRFPHAFKPHYAALARAAHAAGLGLYATRPAKVPCPPVPNPKSNPSPPSS